MGKRIRYPKKKLEMELKEEEKKKEEQKQEQPTHFVLDVHNSTVGGKSQFGN